MALTESGRREAAERRKARERERERLGIVPHRRAIESKEHKQKHDRTGTCLVCGLRSDECKCSGYMTPEAHERFAESQKSYPTPKQSGFER